VNRTGGPDRVAAGKPVPGHRGAGRAWTQVNASAHALAACVLPLRAGRTSAGAASGS